MINRGILYHHILGCSLIFRIQTINSTSYASFENERVIIKKEQFHNIKNLGKVSSYLHVIDNSNGMIFILPDRGIS